MSAAARDRLAGLCVFVVALALRLAYVHEDATVVGLDVSRLSQTDNYVFAQWARTIADGDVLCREQPHAYHLWTRDVAPESKWLEWYGGQQTYHQAPLYPYLVAGIYTLFDRQHTTVGYAQAVLGALTCWLTWLLTKRLVSPLAGFAAGMLLACMGAFYFYDAFVLRDSLMALLTVLLALTLARAVERGRAIDWLFAGASFGLFTLAKETGMPLLALALGLLAWFWRRQPRTLLRAALLLLVGWGVVTAPAFWRNHVVGAPPLRLSTRGPEVIVAGNALGQDGVGWDPPTQTMRRILMDANFQLGGTLVATAATHRSEPWGLVKLVWSKTAACFNAYEVPNNVDFYLHRAHLTSLRLGFVNMAFLAPAALLGLLLGLPRRRQLAVPYLLLFALTASIVVLYILGRFRVQLFPLLAVFAGLSVDWVWRAIRARRLAGLAVATVPFALFVTWCAPSSADPFDARNRDGGLMLQLVKAGNFEQALVYRDRMEDAIHRAPPGSYDDSLAWKLDTIRQAFLAFEEALRWPDASAQRHLHVGRGFSALIPVTKRAEKIEFTNLAQAEFEEALALDREIAGAWYGLGRVDGLNERLGPALSNFTQELVLHPDNAEAHRDAGTIHLTWKHDIDALQHFRAAEALGLSDAEMFAAMARIEVNTALTSTPPVRVAGKLEPVYDNPRGLEHARRALELDGEDPVVMENCAYALYANACASTDWQLADAQFTEALDLVARLAAKSPWRTAELQRLSEGFLTVKAQKQAAAGDKP